MGLDKTMRINTNVDNLLNNNDATTFYSEHNYIIEESIGYLIKHAQVALHRTIDAKMTALDLTALQWAPLMLLVYGKGRTAAELSRCSGVETSTMTRMLDPLETKELIKRERSNSDRRVIFRAY